MLLLCQRLTEAVEGDIAALTKGKFAELRTTDPEIQRLSALYGREVQALKTAGGVKQAPAGLVKSLRQAGARLNIALVRHEKLVECMRKATEGLVQTVAKEVENSRKRGTPYKR